MHTNTLYITVTNVIQNLGPIWKVICCGDMGVEMPAAAVEKILEEQRDWVEDRKKRSGVEFNRKQ